MNRIQLDKELAAATPASEAVAKATREALSAKAGRGTVAAKASPESISAMNAIHSAWLEADASEGLEALIEEALIAHNVWLNSTDGRQFMLRKAFKEGAKRAAVTAKVYTDEELKL
jgi:hypothetical protein